MPTAPPPHSICLVISTLAKPGGAEKNAALMANFWARSKVNVTLLTFDEPSSPLFYELDANVRLQPLDLAKRPGGTLAFLANNLKRIVVLRRAIREAKPEVVVSFITATNVLVLLACIGLKQKVIVCERSVPDLVPERRLTRWLSKLTYRRAAAVVVQSRRAAEHFFPALRGLLWIIPNPVLETDVVRVGREKNSRDLVAVGRFTEEKCFDKLISAFSNVAGLHPDWHLTIYGEGPLRAELRALVAQLGLGARVSLPGYVKDTTAKVAAADLFALTSRFEGFPNALCEAMSVGLPVISTNCPGGVQDLVRDGVDGILVPVNDVEALSGALDHLMSHPAERERLSSRAREVTQRFDVNSVMEMWNEALAAARGEA